MTPAPAIDTAGFEATQEHPAEEPLIPPSGDDPTAIYKQLYGDRYERLPLQLINIIRETVKKFGQQDRYLRRVEVLRDRKWRFYEKGIQHIFETNGGQFIQGTSGAVVPCAQGSIQMGEFEDDYDIFGPYCRIQQSVVTQTVPEPQFEPVSPTETEDTESVKAAQGYWHLFSKNNDLKLTSEAIMRMFQLSARAISYTRTEANAQKYGLNDSGQPRRVEVVDIFGTLEHKCNILAKDLSGTLYNIIYRDPDVKQAKADHPGSGYDGKPFREKINANTKGLGEDEYERMARIGVLQGGRMMTAIGESLNHIATTADCWLRPASFIEKECDEAFTEGVEGDPNQGKSLRDALSAMYPSGVHGVFVGDVYVGSWDESTDDALEIQLPYKGDGMFGRAIADPMGVVQDFTNDTINAFRECANFGWPSTWINADEMQFNSITKNISAPYMLRQFELARKEGKLSDNVYREQELAIPETLNEFMQWLQGPFAQFIFATPPALYGESMPDQKTSSGYHLAAAQAMGQLGLFYGRIQRMFSRIGYQASILASKNPDHSKTIAIPGGSGTQTVELARISKDKFRAFPDDDSSFPESVMQRRAVIDKLMPLAIQNPVLGEALYTPRNLKTILSVEGLTEIVIPQAEVADKVQFTIELLLQQSPLPPDPMQVEQMQTIHAAAALAARTSGQPEMPFAPLQPQPSITPGPLDYHQWEFEYCQEWMSSQARRDEEAKGNTAGVMNVQLYALAQQAMIPPPPMMPMPAPGAPAPHGRTNPHPMKPTPAPAAPTPGAPPVQ